MRDRTIKFIYSIKSGRFERKTLKEEAIAFMSDYTGSPESVYTPERLYQIVKNFFLDYLSTADNPSYEVSMFFHEKDGHLVPNDDTDAMLNVMQLSRVKRLDGGTRYVNGFRDVE